MKVFNGDLSYTNSGDALKIQKEHVQLETLEPYHLNVSLEVNGYEPSVLQETWDKLAKSTEEGKHYLGIPLDNPFVTPKEKCRYLCGVVLEDNDESANYKVNRTDALTITIANPEISRDEINSYYYQLYNEFPSVFGVETAWEHPFEFVYLNKDADRQQYEAAIHKICIPVKKK